MRYSEWFKRTGDATPSQRAVDVGRKLLGYLSIRRQTPGVQTLVERVTLDDGTVVEAAFYGDQPRVIIHTPDGGEACELYVESGLLDLGPNIAPDAAQRFNRGPPEFDDRPATLYFGNGVQCVEGEPGLNGKVRIDSRSLSSQCLPNQGNGIESRLTDPVKKQAQAMLPASCWSGLMQRYVQAVYGGDALDYSATPTALTIDGHGFVVASSWGLLNFDGILAFVNIGDESAVLYEVTTKSACHRAVFDLWRSMPDRTEAQRYARNKVLSIALSAASIGDKIGVVGGVPSGSRHFTDRAAWAFHPTLPAAVAVLENGGVATAYLVTFGRSDSSFSVSFQVVANGSTLNTEHWPLMQSSGSPFSSPSPSPSGFSGGTSHLYVGSSFEFPVAAYFNADGDRIVIYATAIAADTGIIDTSTCYDTSNLYDPLIVGSNKSRQCVSDIGNAVTVAYGFHAAGWSSVRSATCFESPSEAGVVVRSRHAGVIGIDSDMEPAFSSSILVNGTGPDFYVDGTDDLIQTCAWSGAESYGCQTVNAGNGSCVPYTIDKDPADIPCVTRYLEAGPHTYTTTYEWEYIPLDAAVFQGEARSIGVQFLSIPWGASDCFVIDSYDLIGATGGYASFRAACDYFRSGRSASVAQRFRSISGSATTTFSQYNYATPGDCGSPQNYVGNVPGTVTYSLIRPPHDGLMSISLSGACDIGVMGKIRFIPDGYGSDAPLLSMYSYPATRGMESARTSVFADGVHSESIVESGVYVYRDDGAGFVDPEHAGDATPYEANDSIAGQCEPFYYCGLQEIVDSHIGLPLANENGKAWALQEKDANWLLEGFSYQAARSLLGAKILPVATTDRGASINMDRQAISGGYPTVNTPSFVGWA